MPEIATPLLPVPELPPCVCVPPPPEKLCIEFPVVGEICTTRSTMDYQPISGLLLSFVGNLQPLLAPMMPVLRLISIVVAVIDCMKAIPKAISRLSPSPILDCLEKLSKLLPGLLEFVPPFNYIALMRSIVFFLITLVQVLIDTANGLLNLNLDARLLLLPQDDQYLCCLDANIRAKLLEFEAAVQPVGPLFKLIAEILGILGIPGTEDYIDPIKEMAEFLSGGGSEINEEFVNRLISIQEVLEAIHSVLGGIVGAVQTSPDCGC